MKKLNAMLIILFLCSMVTSSCMDEPPAVPDEDQLPEVTSEGRNILGCRVNGKLFLSQRDVSLSGKKGPEIMLLNNEVLSIFAPDLHKMTKTEISLAIKYEEGKKDYILDYHRPPIENSFFDRSDFNEIMYRKIDSEPHYLKLHHLDEHIAAGTFAFTAVSDQGDTVRITDGRFDIKRD